mgnify:CR=1 FL=1
MGKKFLAPFARLFASFAAAVLVFIPGTTEATQVQSSIGQTPTLEQMATSEISDFVLQRSDGIDSSISQFHSSHRSHSSHSSHSSHRSHYSSRW